MLIDAKGNIVAPPIIRKGIRQPDNIEQLWTKKELAEIGLYSVTPEEYATRFLARSEDKK